MDHNSKEQGKADKSVKSSRISQAPVSPAVPVESAPEGKPPVTSKIAKSPSRSSSAAGSSATFSEGTIQTEKKATFVKQQHEDKNVGNILF